jgi:hypothetical protein
MHLTQARVEWWLEGEHRHMSLTVRFQETLPRLAAIDEGFAEDGARHAPGPAAASAPGPQDRGVAASPGAGGDRVASGLPGMKRWTGAGGGRG